MFKFAGRGGRLTRRDDSLAFQSAVLTGARGLGFLIATATPIVLVRAFDLEAWGTYKAVFLIASTAIVFCNLGFNASIFYFVPRAREDGHNYVVQALLSLTLLSTLAAIGLLLGRDTIAIMMDAPELARYLPFVALYVLLAIPGNSDASIPIVDQRPILAAWITTGAELLRASTLVIAAVVFHTVVAVVWAAAFVALARVIVLLIYMRARRESKPTPIRWSEWKSQIAYAIPFGIAVIFEQALMRGHQFYVAGALSIEEFGIYAIGVFQVPVIGMLVGSIAEVVIVQAASAHQNENVAELRRLWRSALKPLAVMLIPVWAVCEVVTPELIDVLFGADFATAVPIFRIFLFAVLAHIVLDHSILRATGDTRFLVWANATGFLVSVVALLVLTRWDVMLGAVSSYVIGFIVIRFLGLYKVSRRLDVRMIDAIPWGIVGRSLGVAALSGALAHLSMRPFDANWIRLIVGCAVFGLAYAAMVWIFHLLPRDQIVSLTRRFSVRSGPDAADDGNDDA